jgi:hypothetical protein
MKKIFYLFTITALLMAVFTTCNKGVTEVKLNETSLTLEVGEFRMLVTTVLPKDAENKEVAWTSSNFAVATVAPTGVIRALSEGVATITATTIDGNFKANCHVQVIAPTPERLLTQSNGWILTAGIVDPPFDGSNNDLFDGFLYDCELDDIIYFKLNKTQILQYGEELCDWQTDEEEILGNWSLSNNESLSYYFLDFGDPVNATILTLNATTLGLVFQVKYDWKKSANNPRWNSTAKTDQVFTIIYSKAF